MTTRGYIATPTPTGWTGSYHHVDSGPPLAEHLAALVAEHGADWTAARFALAGWPWWNIIGTDPTLEPEQHRTGRWLSPTRRPPQTMRGYPRRLHTEGDHWPAQWVQLICPDGTIESRRNP